MTTTYHRKHVIRVTKRRKGRKPSVYTAVVVPESEARHIKPCINRTVFGEYPTEAEAVAAGKLVIDMAYDRDECGSEYLCSFADVREVRKENRKAARC